MDQTKIFNVVPRQKISSMLEDSDYFYLETLRTKYWYWTHTHTLGLWTQS